MLRIVKYQFTMRNSGFHVGAIALDERDRRRPGLRGNRERASVSLDRWRRNAFCRARLARLSWRWWAPPFFSSGSIASGLRGFGRAAVWRASSRMELDHRAAVGDLPRFGLPGMAVDDLEARRQAAVGIARPGTEAAGASRASPVARSRPSRTPRWRWSARKERGRRDRSG
jgi:hypothetical protein